MTLRYLKQRLPNGITIASAKLPGMESVSLGIWVKAGGRYEKKEKAGISHFLEHLLFKGTEARSCTDLKQAIEGIGGSFNAFTGEEFTCYLVKVLGRYLPISVDILSDMVLHATLPEEEIEKERRVILEEIKMEMDMPMHFVNELLNGLLWPRHPLGMELAGTPGTVRAIQRTDLLGYRDFYYHPKNLFVIACGAIRHQQLVEEVRKHLLRIPGKRPSSFRRVNAHPPKASTKFVFKKTAQTHLALGLPGLNRDHPDQYALSLLNVVLGGNMSSRLFHEVRENRGLAYEIGSHLRRFHDTGAFVINAGVDAKKAPESIEVILRELEKVKEEEVSKEELHRAKEYYMGQLCLALEDTSDHMLWIGESLVTMGRAVRPEEVLKKIEGIEPAELKEVARRLFRNDVLQFALIGPQSERERNRMRRILKG
ncbi:MAG: insulinase family protein [Candidatus Omnitrophica bacterium]|nr:insulinase family protein [Candidatus Omnitrophota bacterium]